MDLGNNTSDHKRDTTRKLLRFHKTFKCGFALETNGWKNKQTNKECRSDGFWEPEKWCSRTQQHRKQKKYSSRSLLGLLKNMLPFQDRWVPRKEHAVSGGVSGVGENRHRKTFKKSIRRGNKYPVTPVNKRKSGKRDFHKEFAKPWRESLAEGRGRPRRVSGSPGKVLQLRKGVPESLTETWRISAEFSKTQQVGDSRRATSANFCYSGHL